MAADKALDRILGKIPILGTVVKEITEFSPHLEDEATVEVVGQPGSTKKQLYFLALSAAFSLVRRIDLKFFGRNILPPPGMLMIEYDAADHWVRATIRYRTSMLQAAAANLAGANALGGLNPFSEVPLNTLPVYAGPKCDVVGASFSFTGGVTPEESRALSVFLPGVAGFLDSATAGIPTSSTSAPAPKLPFAGKTILTPCAQVADPNPDLPGAGGAVIPSPNPKPPGDNRSRGAVVTGGASGGSSFLGRVASSVGGDGCCINKSTSLVPLVFAALTDPGSFRDEVFAPPGGGVLGV